VTEEATCLDDDGAANEGFPVDVDFLSRAELVPVDGELGRLEIPAEVEALPLLV
jgi:hypothetical protein